MNKKELTEADIRTKFITPALLGPTGSKWNVMTQLREELHFTRGRVIVRGKTLKRGDAKKADYVLYYKPSMPIAVIEAKDNNYGVGDGMQQALEYAEILDVPFAYSSNGDAFLEHDRTRTTGTVEKVIPLDQFPSAEDLWARYRAAKF
jgi:type I restriction enzyme R subunit